MTDQAWPPQAAPGLAQVCAALCETGVCLGKLSKVSHCRPCLRSSVSRGAFRRSS